MTRKAVPFGLGWISGLFLSYRLCVGGKSDIRGFALLAAVATFVCLAAIIAKKPHAVLFCVTFAAATAYSALWTSLRLLPLERLDGSIVEVTGRVTSVTSGDRSVLTVSGEIGSIPAKVLVYSNNTSCLPGDVVRLTARVSKLEDTPFFSARSYYLPDGVFLTASADGDIEILSSNHTLVDIIQGYSSRVSQKIRRYAGESGGLLSAIVTGDRTAYSDTDRLALSRSGIAHLAAVSGLHVGIVALTVSALLKKLCAPRALTALFCEALVSIYVVFTGLRPSAIRAGIMITVGLLSWLARRRADPLNTLSLCAVAMTLGNPFAAADSSLILSLAGTFGVAVVASTLNHALNIQSKLAKSVTASLSACACCAPFLALWFNELSLASPLTNLVALPLCAASLILGMLFAVTGCTFPLLIKAAGALCTLVLRCAEAIASLNFLRIPLGYGFAPLLIGLSGIAVTAVALTSRKPKSAAMAAFFCAAVVISANSVARLASVNKTSLTALCDGDSSALVLHSGAECIIIDFNGDMAAETEYVAERYGLEKLRAVVLPENSEAALAAYLSLPALEPDSVYTSVPKGFGVVAFGCELTIDDSKAVITSSDGEITVTSLRGLLVISDGTETSVYRGPAFVNMRIGEKA